MSGYLTPTRVLPDGRALDVMPLLYGRARLLISPNERSNFYDDAW